MAYIAKTLLITIIICLCVPAWGAKTLSDKEKQSLCNIVKAGYEATQMEGSSLRKFKGKKILISIVAVKKSASTQRVAQVKAARSAGEFLQGAVNKSVTVYETLESDTYAIDENNREQGDTHNARSEYNITQQTSDHSAKTTEERITDKVVQSALTQVNHIEPLCAISGNGAQQVFAYYMILEK